MKVEKFSKGVLYAVATASFLATNQEIKNKVKGEYETTLKKTLKYLDSRDKYIPKNFDD